MDHLAYYANSGLRTLIFAYKEIKQDDYDVCEISNLINPNASSLCLKFSNLNLKRAGSNRTTKLPPAFKTAI